MAYSHRIFIYGTLKRGERNHKHYCHGAKKIIPAYLPGRLYECIGWRYLFPSLEIPEALIIHHASDSLESDHQLLQSLNDYFDRPNAALPQWSSDQVSFDQGPERWKIIQGEYYEFEDEDLQRLKRLDQLEGFKSDQPDCSEYLRVIVPVLLEDDTWQSAWIYINHGDIGNEPSAYRYYDQNSWHDLTK